MSQVEAVATVASGQYLTFSIAGEQYGVDILSVQEIKGFVATTRVPNSPPEMLGVLNLRGTIVPIIDLRKKFCLPDGEYDAFAAIVVVVVKGRVMGMVVDRVSEVVSISGTDIQRSEGTNAFTSNRFVHGMGRVGDALVILLEVEQILAETSAMDGAA